MCEKEIDVITPIENAWAHIGILRIKMEDGMKTEEIDAELKKIELELEDKLLELGILEIREGF